MARINPTLAGNSQRTLDRRTQDHKLWMNELRILVEPTAARK
jgi:hypothetical protein